MKIRWTQEALEQLIEIEDYIAKDSPECAIQFIYEILDHVKSTLPGNPRIGRMAPEISNPDIREMIYKKYRIVYRVKEDAIEILTVFEGHRLLRTNEIGQ